MNVLSISLRNLRTRALSSTLTTVSIMLGTALLSALWLLIHETEQRYSKSTAGYDAIVGPQEGSPLALVLNTVFNLGVSPGVVPLSVYEELHDRTGLGRKVLMRYAIPQARGDSYRGYPIVGTTDDMLGPTGEDDKQFFFTHKDADDEPVPLAFAEGRPFRFGHEQFLEFARARAAEIAAEREGETNGSSHGHDDEHDHEHGEGHDHFHRHPEREAVIGADVAKRLGLTLGDLVTPTHGKADMAGAHVHWDSMCEVVGILEPTGTPIDRVIYIPISTFLSMDKHAPINLNQDAEAGNIGLTAIIVRSYNKVKGGPWLRYEFQTRADAQVAWPFQEVQQLLRVVGDATTILRVVSYLVLVVAAISILVALYNTMNERRREIAIMRSLGARRWQILLIILQEAVLISTVGAVLGVLLCHGAVWIVGDWIADRSGVSVDPMAFSMEEAWLILGAALLGGFAGILPAIKGSRTEVADNLGPIS